MSLGVFGTPSGGFDLARGASGHLLADISLRTTVLLLLLTEGRQHPEDKPTDAPRGGWWGNTYPDVPDWELGSRLHILTRGKNNGESVRLIEQEIRLRLQCLLEDGIASAITVEIEAPANGERWNALVGVYQDTTRVEWVQVWGNTI